MREVLTCVRTYYVSPSGSDANNGLTAVTPFSTIQAAINACYAIDLGNYGVLIQLANGTYAGATTWAPFVGGNPLNGPTGFGGSVTIRGDVSAPGNVAISVTNNVCLKASYGAIINIEGVKFNVAGSGGALYASANGQIWISNSVEFGSCAGDHMLANFAGFISAAHNYIISGGAVSHYRAANGGGIEAYGLTVFVNNSPTFSRAFTWAWDTGIVNTQGNNYTANTSGQTYDIKYNAVVNASGGWGGYPGTIQGVLSNGGVLR